MNDATEDATVRRSERPDRRLDPPRGGGAYPGAHRRRAGRRVWTRARVEIVHATIIDIARTQGAQLAQAMGGDSLADFAETLRFWTQDQALEIEVLARSEEAFDFNVTRCRYADSTGRWGLRSWAPSSRVIVTGRSSPASIRR